jgi:hypothetical protein
VRKTILTVLFVGVIAAAAYYQRRPIVMLVDQVYTVRASARSFKTITYEGDGSGGVLHLDDQTVSMNQIAEGVPQPRIGTTKQGELAITVAGQIFPFGRTIDPDALSAHVPAGDETTFEIRRSVLSWPNPFEVNWMTGNSPRWKRFRYQHLVWKKNDRSELDMVWRFEQYYYASDGWTEAWMTDPGSTGLIRVRISPANSGRAR